MGIAMIKAEKLSYSFPQKDLYNNISFTLEDDVHCAFIGTNGTGKSTLVDMILQPDNYLYEGKLTVEVPGRIGYVSQFYSVEDKPEMTVFDYLSDEFVRLQGEINRICDEMATAEDFEEVMEHYQKAMDEFQAMDRMEIKVQLQSSMGKFFRIFFENTIRIKGSTKAQRT